MEQEELLEKARIANLEKKRKEDLAKALGPIAGKVAFEKDSKNVNKKAETFDQLFANKAKK